MVLVRKRILTRIILEYSHVDIRLLGTLQNLLPDSVSLLSQLVISLALLLATTLMFSMLI